MKNIKQIVVNQFPDIKFKKIVLYRHPKECNHIQIERVNPNHIGILWGRRKKKLHKGTNFIQIGRVYFEFLPLIFGLSVAGWLDMFTSYSYHILLSIGLYSFVICCMVNICYWYILLRLVKKCSIY